MKQVQIYTISDALTLGQKAMNGATVHNDIIVINTTATITVDHNALALARDNYELGKALSSERRAAVREKLAQSRDLLMLTRDILKPYFGNEYNESWDVTGLKGSLVIPRTADEVQPLLQTFKAHFVANPEREQAGLQVTATNLQALYDDMVTAQNAVITQDTVVQGLKAARDEKFDQMLKRIRDVMGELAMKITPMDPRWLAFGFNLPGAEETPDVPSNVVAILIGPNAAAVKWNAAARAAYYRVWTKVHGGTTDYAVVGSPADLDFTIENLPANSSIDIVVSAVNDGGESQLSEPITIVTH